MIFNRKNAQVEAVQWYKVGDHPNVTAAGPSLYRKGEAGYITGVQPHPTSWVQYEPMYEKPPEIEKIAGIFAPMIVQMNHPETGKTYWRKVWDFSMWKLSGDRKESPIEITDLFYQDCLLIEQMIKRQKFEWVSYGWIHPEALKSDGFTTRVVVYPGDWIVTPNPKIPQSTIIYSDEEFQREFEVAQAPTVKA